MLGTKAILSSGKWLTRVDVRGKDKWKRCFGFCDPSI